MNNSFSRVCIKTSISLIFVLFVLSVVSFPVLSAPRFQTRQFSPGDYFISLDIYRVGWYDTNGKLIQMLDTQVGGMPGGLAINPVNKNLYVTTPGNSIITIFNSVGKRIATLPTDYQYGFSSILCDRYGNIYAGGSIGSQGYIVKFDKNGKIIREFVSLPVDYAQSTGLISGYGPYLWMDLSSDQKTIYYTSMGRTIRQLNISGISSQVFNFVELPSLAYLSTMPDPPTYNAEAISLLYPGDGSKGLLVADGNDIKRVDKYGAVIQVYSAKGQDNWRQISLSSDGASFWSVSDSGIYKFDLDGNGEGTLWSASTAYVIGLVFYNEYIASAPTPTFTPSATRTNIPTRTRTHTPTPTSTRTPTRTNTPTRTLTRTATPTRTKTLNPSLTSTKSYTPTYTKTNSVTPSTTFTRTWTPSVTLTTTQIVSPSDISVFPTEAIKYPTETLTSTPNSIPIPTYPGRESQETNFFSIIHFFIFIIIIMGMPYMLVRVIKSKQRVVRQVGPHQLQIQIKIHEDRGQQTAECSLNTHLPQVRLVCRSGKMENWVEENPSSPD